ncbi:MAG: NADH-quinone oxidoreductase subunit N [Anaerolineae bacterium]|nr:NADH-quinone oxidoreductase subunit N [Anaerolineae bacterium]
MQSKETLMVFNTDLTANLMAVVPEIALVILGIIVLGLDLYSPESRRGQVGYWAGFGLIGVAVANLFAGTPETLEEQLVLGGMLRHDDFTQIFRTMSYVAAALTCFIAMGDRRLRYKGEFYLIIIVATMGASLMSGAADLVMVFLSLETLSISLYALAGFVRDDDRSAESGLKYFLLGSFASAFTLYGFSLLYGFTGQTNIYLIGQALAAGAINEVPVLLAMLMVTVGFGFKISAVPFHFWTPDVYEGAPTAMTAYVSVASKAVSFALLLRFLLAVFPPSGLVTLDGVETIIDYSDFWVSLTSVLAVITMTLGNVLALMQRNIKRLLAYSSIAQAGYTLIGVAAIATTDAGDGAASVAFYMFMYVLTNILAFGCVIVFANATGSETIADFASLGRRNMWLAIFLTIALLSLAGIPPAAGFVGKFLLFRVAIDAGLIWLTVVGVLNSIIALYYYLVVIKVMFVDPNPQEDEAIALPRDYAWVLGATAVGVLLLGTILAQPFIAWASEAGLDLFL